MTELFNITVYNYLMIFLRVGAVFMLMPGFSASYVNTQVRLVLALALSLIIMPFLTPALPPEHLAGQAARLPGRFCFFRLTSPAQLLRRQLVFQTPKCLTRHSKLKPC